MVDDSVFMGLSTQRGLFYLDGFVSFFGFWLGQFVSIVIVRFNMVCPVFLGLSFLRSGFLDGDG